MVSPASARTSVKGVARLMVALLAMPGANSAWAGSAGFLGIEAEYRVTLTYALAQRLEAPHAALIDGPVDTQQVSVNLVPSLQCVQPPCLGGFGHTGLPTTVNFDDGNRDFARGALINNRISGFGQLQLRLPDLGLGEIGGVVSGAAHYDDVFFGTNDHDNPDSVNRMGLDAGGDREGPVNEWHPDARAVNGRRHRLLESYAYGAWYLTDTIGLSVRAGRHLAAWGESLFFPGIVSAQGPFDATKANVPGVEVKEVLLPVNQVSLQMSLTPEVTLLGYHQFEFRPTEVFAQGDFFSPADLIGPGATFGYGSINPLHPDHCAEPAVTDSNGLPAPAGTLCLAGQAFDNEPEYIMTVRTPDALPSEKDQWGAGLKYQLLPDLGVGAYYLRYHNHNPGVALNMGYPRIGDVLGQPVTTETLGVRVPVSYTVNYAEGIEMTALSFSTVLWSLNVGGELIRRDNVDTSLEATIAGVIAPVGTRGRSTTAQLSMLYVNNPDFLMYDEVAVVAEFAWTQMDKVQGRPNEDGICYTGTTDCLDFTQHGTTLFYDERSWATQVLVAPKGRNAFAGWDLGTPLSLAWLVDGTPPTAGVFGALYGEGDLRASLGLTAQYLQNLEFAASYNAFFGDPEKNIGNSTLRANPFTDRDYLALSVKWNL